MLKYDNYPGNIRDDYDLEELNLPIRRNMKRRIEITINYRPQS